MKRKKEVTLEALRYKKKVHFATLMDICHSKKRGVATKIAEEKRQSFAPWYKTTLGASAVFFEQGSSASQMTAAKAVDVIAILPDCDGQAADAVSAYTHVKLEEAPRLLRIPVRMSRYLDTSTETRWPKSWPSMEDPVVPLERNLCGRPLAGLSWERQHVEETLVELGWENVPNWK